MKLYTMQGTLNINDKLNPKFNILSVEVMLITLVGGVMFIH